MRILLVSATREEISPVLGMLGLASTEENFMQADFKEIRLEILITGVGMISTALHLGKRLRPDFDFVLNAGLAGSFNRHLNMGSVVNVTQDVFSELGAEDGNDFIPVTAMNLGVSNEINNLTVYANPVLKALPAVNGITVNTVHGNEQSIENIWNRFHPFTESMEGAAFLMACNSLNLPCAQLRCISNMVERRNRAAWDIPLAVKNLNAMIIEILNAF